MEKASGQRNNAAKKSTDDVSQGHPVCIQKMLTISVNILKYPKTGQQTRNTGN